MQSFEGISRNMNIADKYFRLYLRDALAPYDLNTTEGTVLLMIYGKDEYGAFHHPDGSTQDEIIKELHYDKGVMTRTMKSLEEKGYVERHPNPDDSRSFIFSATEKGLSFKGTLVDILRRWTENLLKGIDEETLLLVQNTLNSISRNAVMFYKKEGMGN